MDKGFYHNIHGDKLHDTMRFLIKRRIIEKGGKIKDTKVFKDRACRCEPDVYCEFESKKISGNKRSPLKETYVIEVETNPSAESIKKKYEQYKESLAGLTDLIIFDMNEGYIRFVADDIGASAEDIKNDMIDNLDIYSDLYLMERYIDWKLPL